MKIAIGNDHAGTEYKKVIMQYLLSENYQVTNVGTDTPESVDYPDFAHPIGEMIDKGEVDWGIVICGSGNMPKCAVPYAGIKRLQPWLASITMPTY